MREYLEDLRENWDDAYWRADHPEVIAVVIAVLTGVLGLAFVWVEIRMRRSVLLPQTADV
jgi:hypothetical protein